ncbi:MAG: flavoprotein, partial [Candidatus Marinimicrobia bacterium]|nr:flavoprotein [Candidatus Neomarinimicrobiota bacterium]
MSKKIVVGISGASGVVYGVRLLSVLREKNVETHLIISNSGEKNIQIETDYNIDEVKKMASYVYDHKNMAAKVA